jgi:glycosyltransferase involved in cell wall biosynthesis
VATSDPRNPRNATGVRSRARIAIFVPDLTGTDGWSRYALDLVREMGCRGHEVLCITARATPEAGVRELPVLHDAKPYVRNPLQAVWSARKLRAALRDWRPDILHFIAEPYVLLLPFLQAGTPPRPKAVLTVHGSYAYAPNIVSRGSRRVLAAFFFERALRRLDTIIPVSRYTREYLRKSVRSRRLQDRLVQKLHIVTNGLDTRRFARAHRRPRPGDRTAVILFVGAVKPRKGLLEAIEGLRRYREHFHADFRYRIVGRYSDGSSYVRECKRRIRAYGLEGQVEFTGGVSEARLADLYASADVLLLLSVPRKHRFEGFGLVYLEANFHGVPCIGSQGSGAEDAIREGVTGYLVDPEDPEQIAERLHRILQERALDAEQCIAWAEENSVAAKCQELEQLYCA